MLKVAVKILITSVANCFTCPADRTLQLLIMHDLLMLQAVVFLIQQILLNVQLVVTFEVLKLTLYALHVQVLTVQLVVTEKHVPQVKKGLNNQKVCVPNSPNCPAFLTKDTSQCTTFKHGYGVKTSDKLSQQCTVANNCKYCDGAALDICTGCASCFNVPSNCKTPYTDITKCYACGNSYTLADDSKSCTESNSSILVASLLVVTALFY